MMLSPLQNRMRTAVDDPAASDNMANAGIAPAPPAIRRGVAVFGKCGGAGHLAILSHEVKPWLLLDAQSLDSTWHLPVRIFSASPLPSFLLRVLEATWRTIANRHCRHGAGYGRRPCADADRQ
jgi:hypothetical protein